MNGKELIVRLEEAPRAPLRFRVEGKVITLSKRGVFTLATLGKTKKGEKSEVDRVARQPEP